MASRIELQPGTPGSSPAPFLSFFTRLAEGECRAEGRSTGVPGCEGDAIFLRVRGPLYFDGHMPLPLSDPGRTSRIARERLPVGGGASTYARMPSLRRAERAARRDRPAGQPDREAQKVVQEVKGSGRQQVVETVRARTRRLEARLILVQMGQRRLGALADVQGRRSPRRFEARQLRTWTSASVQECCALASSPRPRRLRRRSRPAPVGSTPATGPGSSRACTARWAYDHGYEIEELERIDA